MEDAVLDRMFFGTETIESLQADITLLKSIKPSNELEKKQITVLLKGKNHILDDAKRRKALR